MKKALVALHGFLGSPQFWSSLKDQLESEITLYAPDLYKDAEFKDSNWEKWPRQLSNWIRERGLREPVILMGYSMGGRLALDFAIQNPRSVSHLILISTRAGRPQAEELVSRKKWEQGWHSRFRSEEPSKWWKDWNAQEVFSGDSSMDLRLDLSGSEVAHSFQTWSLSSQPGTWEDLNRLSCPTLWLFGDRDQKYKTFQALTRTYHPKSQVYSLPEAGHRIPLDQPTRLGEHIKVFTKKGRTL